MRWAAERYNEQSNTAENLAGVSYIVGACALLLFAVAVVMVVRNTKKMRHFDAKVDTKLGSIEFAVNGVEKGESPLIDKVRWLEDCMSAIGKHLGLELPPARSRRTPDARTRATDKEHP